MPRGPRASSPAAGWSTDAGRALPEPEPAAEPAPAPAQTRRRPRLAAPEPGTTTRVTVDVPRTDHRALKRTAEDMADDLGIGSVPVGQVMAALAHLVTTDPSLRDSVVAHLRIGVVQ